MSGAESALNLRQTAKAISARGYPTISTDWSSSSSTQAAGTCDGPERPDPLAQLGLVALRDRGGEADEVPGLGIEIVLFRHGETR